MKEPWFRVTWTGFMPIHRIGWLLTLGAAMIVTVLIAIGALVYSSTGDLQRMAAPGAIAFGAVAVLFTVALTRTERR